MFVYDRFYKVLSHPASHLVLTTKRSISIRFIYEKTGSESNFLRITQLLKHRAGTET